MRLARPLCLLVACGVVLGTGSRPAARERPVESVPGGAELVARFLSGDRTPLTQYRALRRLTAVTRGGKMTATLTAWTELDGGRLRTEIINEAGSGHIRSRVFRRFLENEMETAARGEWRQADFTLDNYEFAIPEPDAAGLVRVGITPRRADTRLIDGVVLLTAGDGDLVRVEGHLAKRPSFWTRRVDVVRTYGRIAGVRVPLAMESEAKVRIAGASTFTIRWEYESVNGQRVGSPSPNPLATTRAHRPAHSSIARP